MLANNIIRQFLTQIIGLISGFAISIITARLLGPEGRGSFTLILNASMFLCLLLGFSFGTSIIHVIAAGKMHQRNLINSFLAIIAVLIPAAMIFLLFFPFSRFPFLLPADKQNTLFYCSVLLVIFIISLYTTLFNSVLSGNKKFLQLQKVYVITTVVSVLIYAILYVFRSRIGIDLHTFLYFYLFISLLPVIGSYLMYRKHARPPFRRDFLKAPQLKYVINYSLLSYFCNVFQFLSYRMDFWFVEYFNGSHDLGIYSLAVNLAQMLWLLPQAISTILLSYSGAANSEKGIQNTNALSRIALALIISAALVLFFCIDFIIPSFYGPAFSDSSFLFKILLAGIIPFSITTIIASYFAGTGRMKINLYCSFTGFFVCLIFDLILIPQHGIKGAAIATVIAYFTSTAFIIAVFINQTGSSLRDILFLKQTDIYMLKGRLMSAFRKQ